MLLANIVAIAHAVIPHHHHSKFFVSIVSMCDTDLVRILNHTHTLDCPLSVHNQEINDSLSFIFSIDEVNEIFTQIEKENKASNNIVSIENPLRKIFSPLKPPYKGNPYIEKYKSQNSGRLFLLRAPPFC